MITDQSKLKIGDKVFYQPSHYKEDDWENGIIKEIPEHTFEFVRVVYNCAGDWKHYQDYTSALTSLDDLTLGWKHDYKNTISKRS